jgi:hypothetical protein
MLSVLLIELLMHVLNLVRLVLFVGDSPGGPLKQLGKPCLKPAKNQS